MLDDRELQEAQIRLQKAFARWRDRLRKVGGPQVTDDFAIETLMFLARAHLETEAQHASAVRAHVRAEERPANVIELDRKRAEAAGWDKGEAMGTMPAGSVSIGDIVAPEVVNRLVARMGLDASQVTAEAIRRGFASLVAETLEPKSDAT